LSWEAAASVDSKAPAAAVWALWSDPKRWPEWNDGIREAELEGPFEVGTVARIKFKGGGKMMFTITELEEERLFVDTAKLPGARLSHEHRIEPGQDGITIHNRFVLKGPMSRLYVLMMGRSLKKAVPDLPERERELAEGRK
jgi:uncharacterized protein YndB with AHSA1/START domain